MTKAAANALTWYWSRACHDTLRSPTGSRRRCATLTQLRRCSALRDPAAPLTRHPRRRSKYHPSKVCGQRCFSYQAPVIWNQFLVSQSAILLRSALLNIKKKTFFGPIALICGWCVCVCVRVRRLRVWVTLVCVCHVCQCSDGVCVCVCVSVCVCVCECVCVCVCVCECVLASLRVMWESG